MNFANAIPPKMKRHNAANMTKLFVGIGKLSGNFMTPIAASTIAGYRQLRRPSRKHLPTSAIKPPHDCSNRQYDEND